MCNPEKCEIKLNEIFQYRRNLTFRFLAYTKVIALVILIFAGLYTLFFTDNGVTENFTTLAWANSKFEAGPIVLGLYQVSRNGAIANSITSLH